MGRVIVPMPPDAILESSNLSGTVDLVQDDPDAPNGTWLSAVSTVALSVARFSFPTPAKTPIPGTGFQEFRVLLRKAGGSGTPSGLISLYNNGQLIVNSSTISVASTTGIVVSFAWQMSGSIQAANVECRVAQNSLGGSGGARASWEIGAVEWNAMVEGFSGWGVPL